MKDDVLLVTIQMGKVEFVSEFNDFANRVVEGLTTDMVVIDTVNGYKKYIDNLYFV